VQLDLYRHREDTAVTAADNAGPDNIPLTTDPPPRRVMVDGIWLYQHTCANPVCAIEFTSRRMDARTHTDRCRMALHRARQST
jgi:hypothetical protein